ncbi:MAG: ankyrin repeat protein [Gammaproteobacteria bacterium]
MPGFEQDAAARPRPCDATLLRLQTPFAGANMTAFAKCDGDSGGRSAFEGAFEAARNGDVCALQAMLREGLPLNTSNDAGDSLLMLAAYHAQHALAVVLLDAGADPNQCNDKGQHPLAGVSYKGLSALVELLLAHGANPDGASGAARTPLMYAAMYNHAVVSKALLDGGADAGLRNPDGLTALDLARQMRAVHTIKLLEDAA